MNGALRLFQTTNGPCVEFEGHFHPVADAIWDDLFNAPDLPAILTRAVASTDPMSKPPPAELRAPIGSQEVWAAGVTYWRSRDARMEEAKEAGGGNFYDRVYEADRPELFMKATPHRVVGPGASVRIRSDTKWSVPEPELALAVSADGRIWGCTVGNDMSARDIEGENPLYLPQAKVYDACCALGPGILIADAPMSPDTQIRIAIERDGKTEFEDATELSSMRRKPGELVEYLFRDNSFPSGCFLLTGTGIVPPDAFALRVGDTVRIEIDGIGTLQNDVAQSGLK